MPNSTDNLDLIHRVYDAFDRRDFDALPTLFAADVEIRQSDELPWGGRWHGLSGAVEFFTILLTHLDTVVEPRQLIAAGDQVVEVGRTRGTDRATGETVDAAEVHVWTVRNGQIARMEVYVQHAELPAHLVHQRQPVAVS